VEIDVAFLPKDVEGRDLSDVVCIVVDIFRATTCMVTAFANGCQEIIPVCSSEEAREIEKKIDAETCLLTGERKGLRIEGFHLGNSPLEFTSGNVAHKILIMTTTNGTAAVRSAHAAYRTLIGSFLNAQMVCQHAKQFNKDILIICAGTEQKLALEDALCAGVLVDILWEGGDVKLTDAGKAALLMFAHAADTVDKVAANSSHGRYLDSIGFAADVHTCVQMNTVNIVPEYRDGKILRRQG
jgi:2-phosphosulfolactate phosphatase